MKDPKFIDVEGIKTRYFEAGQGDPLVLVHGGHFGSYSSAYDWGLNFDDLSAHFRVYALDKLGQGETDNPESDADYTMARTIDHVYKFLLALGLRGAVLMGHSRGALPAARIATDHPELVRALVIVDSNTLAPIHPSTPTNFYTRLNKNPPPIPDEEFVRREPEANSYSQDHITADFVEQMIMIARLPKIQEARRKMEHLLIPQFLPDVRKQKYATLDLIRSGRLKAPALILWGLNDPSALIVVGYELFQQIAFATPRTEFHVFNQAGHDVFREHPRELDQIVVGFVESLG